MLDVNCAISARTSPLLLGRVYSHPNGERGGSAI